ncbi:MAG: ABC transporter permease [Planctomycetota bacterium JB042]
MHAILERDVPRRIRERAFFRLRGLAGLAGAAGLAIAVLANEGARPDVIGLRAFTLSSGLVLSVLVLVIPAQFAQLLARERAADALAVLLTTPLSASSLVLGWWTSRLAFAGLLVVPGLPFLALPLVLGGIVPAQLYAMGGLVVATLLWTSALSLAVGARVRNPFAATRTAYLLVALLVLVLPSLGDAPLLRAIGPFQVAGDVAAGTSVPAQLAIHLASAGTVAALSLLLCIHTVRRDGERSRAGSTTPPLARWAARLFAPLVERHPVLWLGCSRGAHLLFHWPSLVAAGGVLLAEGAFWSALTDVYAATGEPLLDGPDGAVVAAGLHARYAASYLGLALLTGVVSAATTFHRELESNTLDVFFSTPLSTERIVLGFCVASLTSAAPFCLLALGHVTLAVLGGSLTPFRGLVFLVCASVGVTYVCTTAFLFGLRGKTPLRSTLDGLRALYSAPDVPVSGTSQTVAMAVSISIGAAFVLSPWILALLFLLLPAFFSLHVLVIGAPWLLVCSLVAAGVYVTTIRNRVLYEIPQQLLIKRDQKYVPLAWYDPGGGHRPPRTIRTPGGRLRSGRGRARRAARRRTEPPE